jgi:DNA-binding winged helix-turn-helix (wHTH) protein
VWGGRIVSESTLASHIDAARRAIGDSGQEQRLIRTIARTGFRFVGEAGKGGRRLAQVPQLPGPPTQIRRPLTRWCCPPSWALRRRFGA